jgi:WD40 repeat protein
VLASDGRLAITASSDGGIAVFDLERLTSQEPFARHDQGVWNLAFAADDRTPFAIGSDQTVRAWDGYRWAARLKGSRVV